MLKLKKLKKHNEKLKKNIATKKEMFKRWKTKGDQVFTIVAIHAVEKSTETGDYLFFVTAENELEIIWVY